MIDLAFEINKDDIITVLESHHVSLKGKKLQDATNSIDDDSVLDAVLSVDFDMNDEDILDKQLEAAYDEIAKQLYENGYIKDLDIAKYGNPTILMK